METTDYPSITCGEDYVHEGEIYNVFGTAIHTNTEETLVIFVDKTDTVYAIPIQEFFQEIDGQPRYRKVIN